VQSPINARNFRLLIVTSEKYRDGLSTVPRQGSVAALFNPDDDRYSVSGGVLHHEGSSLDLGQVKGLVADKQINHPLADPLLILGVFSFLYQKSDLRNRSAFTVSVKELLRFLGHYTGKKRVTLVDKLKEYERVFGVLLEQGKVFPVLAVEELPDEQVLIKSEYLHKLLNVVIFENVQQFDGKRNFYMEKVYSTLASARNKVAAQIVVELLKIAHTRTPHISVKTLASRIPQLHAIVFGDAPLGVRNKRLKRALDGVKGLIAQHTLLPVIDPGYQIVFPEKVNAKSVITIQHGETVQQKWQSKRATKQNSNKGKAGSNNGSKK
jgi:hypothetical protein